MSVIHIFFIIFLLFLVVFSGFFSGSETALTGASKTHLHQLGKGGHKKAKLVQALQSKLSNSISTILITNQMTNHVITTISTWLAIDMFGESKIPAVALFVGMLVIVYAEILPKMLAINYSLKFSLLAAPVINIVIIILRPLAVSLEYISRISLRLFGVKISNESNNTVTDEELRGAIDMHAQSGQEEAQERLMLKSILDLDEVTVEQVMTYRKNLMTLNSELPIKKIINEMLHCPYSRVPLWKGDPENIVGVLYVKSLFRAIESKTDAELEKIDILSLAGTPWFVPENTSLLDQLHAFRIKRLHFALVVDEYGSLMGSVTLEDIIEEIVGEIVDEYDVNTSGIKKQQDGSVIIDGSTPVRDLNREFDWDLPEEASTIAGLLIQEVRRIPEAGQSFSIFNLNIEVIKRRANQIQILKITKNPNVEE